MAAQTPIHLLTVLPPHVVHGLHGTVALLTGYTGRNVPTVFKVDEIREVVDLIPADGLGVFPMLQQLGDSRFDPPLAIFGLNLGVTIHAG